MTRKSLLSALLALVLAFGLFSPAGAKDEPINLMGALVILHTNDIHGRAVADPSAWAIGYAAIAKMKKDLERTGASVLLLDAGDASQGMPIVNLSQGKAAVEFMNAAGYDAMTPGNHEFDWGLDNLLLNRGAAAFPFLAANILDKVTGEPVFAERAIFETANGMKIGVFGLATPETLTKAHPDKMRGIGILMDGELSTCAQAQVNALKAEQCDLVICLGHLGVAEESMGNRSIDVIQNTEGIDLFIDGHSHTALEGGERIGKTLLVSTGEYNQKLGMVFFDGEALRANLYVTRDPDVAALVNAANAEANALLSTIFASTEVTLHGERDPGVRTQETNLGDFAADAILWAARQACGDHVVAAVTNGGGIRASIPAGDITMNDMKTVFPFGNTITVLTVTGAELLEALEAAAYAAPTAAGAFPQVAGIFLTINIAASYEQGEQYPDSTYFRPGNPGSRVTIATVGGEPFDREALYTIATSDFAAAGGDTYYAFAYANATTGYKTGIALEDALVQYVRQELAGAVGQEYAEPQGRIRLVAE